MEVDKFNMKELSKLRSVVKRFIIEHPITEIRKELRTALDKIETEYFKRIDE